MGELLRPSSVASELQILYYQDLTIETAAGHTIGKCKRMTGGHVCVSKTSAADCVDN